MTYRITSFNTSHVVVYRLWFLPATDSGGLFQYISCCSLSSETPSINACRTTFQYISCCSLSYSRSFQTSWKPHVSIHLMLQFISIVVTKMISSIMFQYISCCSLSDKIVNQMQGFVQFQYISCCSLSLPYSFSRKRHFCFNTSHVVVYPWLSENVTAYGIVSIHLMLQFIKPRKIFQY